MNNECIKEILSSQREFFNTGATLPVKFRKKMLRQLRRVIIERQSEIISALASDLGKSEYEAYMCEVGMALSEISYMIKNAGRLARAKRVRTPLAQFPSKSYTLPTPYGNTLIMSPWNYPFLLTIDPLATAIAAGNTAIVKPSAYSPATAELIRQIAEDTFDSRLVSVITGGRKENAALLDLKFDFIFFTGSGAVGREVLRKAAENLTPTVLELGGKSPCIVDESAKIRLAARRIVFGKLLNAGQTCVAPDYILCHSSKKDELVREIIAEIKRQYGENPLENPDYGKIINEKHFDRISALIDKKKTVYGGEAVRESLKISPTVMDNVTFDDAVMAEEIFGPILPVISYDTTDEIISILREREKPLALYIFSENKATVKEITERCSFGGGCVNDCIIHLATSRMGFGGVGESGMGAYHGRVGFESFSHRKSIVKKNTKIDLPMRYQPYKSKFYRRLIGLFLK